MIKKSELEQKGDLFPNQVISVTKEESSVTFHTENDVTLKITILGDGLFRFRYAVKEKFAPDFSYAICPNFLPEFGCFQYTDMKDHYQIKTELLVCHIHKEDMRISIKDLKGNVVLEDEKGFYWQESFDLGSHIVKMSKEAIQDERFFGLGDKATSLDLRGKVLENFVTDQYAYTKDKDPLYKDIPFYIGLRNKVAYGIFFDNSFKSFFDFCNTKNDITTFWAEGGEMNYYFFYGPKMQDVVTLFTDLTGKPELPPMWALGYHQCKFSYYPESVVRDLTSKFRELRIPCDSVHLDIDYMEDFKNFTWNKEYFPNPKKMVSDLKSQGFKIVAILDPGIKIDKHNFVYNQALENDYFCRRADGPYVKGNVWPGECNFPDFTNPEVREWWADLCKNIIVDVGVSGLWNDMNEPAIMGSHSKTFPMDVRHHYDGHHCSHRKAHNIYGTQMARATYEGIKKYIYPKRPFVITRSAYPGAQRYASSWTGDNISSWEHLWIANVQIQRLSISGLGFSGSDIGGFVNASNGELYIRWLQMGVFHPFCRTHSSGTHGDQEPWAFGKEITDIARKFIELRYQLLPYLYTVFNEYVKEGIPMIKPLVYFDQDDIETHHRNDEFICGNQLLVCPIVEEGAVGRNMYIPRGVWYNYWTQVMIDGGEQMWVSTTLHEIPLFVKAGSIIPKYPVQQYVGELDFAELTLDVYYLLGTEKSHLYEDAGDGHEYQTGKYNRYSFTVIGNDNKLTIRVNTEGTFTPKYKKYKMNFIGLPFQIKEIEIDNEKYTFDKKKFLREQSLVVDVGFYEFYIVGEPETING